MSHLTEQDRGKIENLLNAGMSAREISLKLGKAASTIRKEIRKHHEYELYLDLENIDHTKTKAKSPQTNGICERFHKTILNEFYQITFRKKIYDSIEMLQRDLNERQQDYNENRTHSGKYCYGKTPIQTFHDSLPLAKGKMLQYRNNGSVQ